MNKDLNFLLDKSKVEDFLSQRSQEIFGEKKQIQILEIDRTSTYNKSSYNIMYKIQLGDEIKEIRASASEQLSKKTNFELLKFIYTNGFNQGDFLIAKPLEYFEDFNIMFYEHIEGKPLMVELTNSPKELSEKIKLCARLIKKFHGLPKPEVSLWNANDFFEFKNLERGALKIYYPKIATALDSIVTQIKEKISIKNTLSFSHGDFQPNNLIISENKIYVFDFDLACMIQKEFDLANFVNQLRIMTKRFGNFEHFENLKKEFLSQYGQYDQTEYDLYEALVNLRILATFCVSQGREDNIEYMSFIYELLKENLNKIDIKFEEN